MRSYISSAQREQGQTGQRPLRIAMACNSGNCRSGACDRDNLDRVEDRSSLPQPTEANELSNGSSRRGNNSICVKCKVNQTMAAAGSESIGEFIPADDVGRFCGDCFRSNIYGKFRFAVSSNALISPTDNVLVAFSGGPSSRSAFSYVFSFMLVFWVAFIKMV